jgi:hypothetical protein
MMPCPHRRFRQPVAFLALAVALSMLAQAQVWKGRIIKEGDVTVVLNSRDPIYRGPVLKLMEDWTVGAETGGGGPSLAKPWDIAVDEDGLLYVLDVQDACVKVFDGKGAYVRTIGRRGQGPGEIGAAFSIIIPTKAKTLIVNDVRGRRLAFFSLNGVFEKNLPLRGLTDGPVVDSRFDVYIDTTDIQKGRESLKKMTPDLTTVLAEILDRPEDISHNPFKARTRWILDTEDRLILGTAVSYELDVFESDGHLSRKIKRDYDPQKVSKADIDEFLKRGAPPGVNPTYDYSTRHACYRSFFVDDQGHLFVQTWERTPGAAQDIHDIFDAQGRYIGRVALPRHEDLINPTTRIVKKGKLYAIEPDDDGGGVVKRYSLNWLIPAEKGE